MKKSSLFVVGVILVIALVTPPLIGCGSEGAGQEATGNGEVYPYADSVVDFVVNEAILSSALDENGLPVNSTNVFTSDTEEIFCTIWLSGSLCCDLLMIKWLYINTDETISVWDEEGLSITGPVTASITRPENGFPKGVYMVVIYINIEEVISVPFTVE